MSKNNNFTLAAKCWILVFASFCLNHVLAAKQIVMLDHLPECPVQRVTDAILSSDNVIWVIGEQSGIYTFDLKDSSSGKWAEVSTGKEFDFPINCHAIIEDRQGRIWVGTDNQGVMVYNGLGWKSYSIDNALLANRIYDLAVSPLTGEVGIAGSAGVSIYNPNDQTWKDFTRGNGLVEDQVRALAFSNDGGIWFAYACGGLTKGSVKYSADLWQHTQAPWYWDDQGFVRQPLTPSGEGLPSNLCNDIISSSDTIWTATCAGIAYASSKGTSWKYIRGADYLQKNKGVYKPSEPVKRENKKIGNLLPQDYISTLAPAKDGIWIGTRDQGLFRWSPQKGIIEKPEIPPQQARYEITTIINFPDGSVGYGTNGKGFGIVKNGSGKWMAQNGSNAIPKHPETPPLPTEQQIMELLTKSDRTTTRNNGVYLGEDWMTKGNWPGRYGNVYALLYPGDSYTTGFIFGKRKKYITEDMYMVLQDYFINGFIGPHRTDRKSYISTIHDEASDNINALFNPGNLARKEAVCDDGGADYPDTWDGPDLWVRIIVPDGSHQFDLYFYNTVDNTPDSFKADFFIELRKDPLISDNLQEPKKPSVEDIKKLYSLPVTARARVSQFSGSGVYQQFACTGQGVYWFRISKNNSPSARLNGIFISKFISPMDFDPMVIKKEDVYFDKILPLPPQLESKTINNHLNFLGSWDLLSRENLLSPSEQSKFKTCLIYQYRKLDKNEENRNLKKRLAWDLGILTKNDYSEFSQLMLKLKTKREKERNSTHNNTEKTSK